MTPPSPPTPRTSPQPTTPVLSCLSADMALDETNRQHDHNHASAVGGTSGLGAGGVQGVLESRHAEHQAQNNPAQEASTVGGAGGRGKGLANGEATVVSGSQQLPPAPQPPSSWASKVRAGLGSDNSPILAGSTGDASSGGGGGGSGLAAGSGVLGGMSSGDLDPGVGEGIQGLSHSHGMGHLGPLASSIGGGAMGPVHGLDMEGGMPGRSLQPSAPASAPAPGEVQGLVQGLVGAVGMGLGGVGGGHQDPLQLQQHQQQHQHQQQQQAGLRSGGGLGNGAGQGARQGDEDGLNGTGALAQDFTALDIGKEGGLGAPRGAGTGTGEAQQGFDASKDELLGDFPCVRLRGLAADTSVKDILDFFVGLGPVLDIVLEVSDTRKRAHVLRGDVGRAMSAAARAAPADCQ